jgi:hypothetical protein
MDKKLISTVCAVCLVVSGFLLLQISGCGGGSDNTRTGVLKMGITDAPAAPLTFDSVHVMVDKVVVVPAGREGLADDNPALPVVATFPNGVDVDILSLHFLPQILGSATIPAGSYSQVRLILAPNQPTLNNYAIVTGDPTHRALTTPSAQETGLKIIGKFTVTAGVINTVLLDFNPNTAIVRAGNSGQLILKPTGIRILEVSNSLANSGAVTGQIVSSPFATWSSATVTAVQRNPSGSTVASGTVFSNFTSSNPGVWSAPFTVFLPPNGSAAVPSANYKLFVQAFSHTAAQSPVFSLYSSPPFSVTAGVDTSVPPSGTVLLAP